MFVITYALNEVATILEVRVQKTTTLVQKLLSPFAYEVHVHRLKYRLKYLEAVSYFAFFMFGFFYLACLLNFLLSNHLINIANGIADSFQIFWESCVIFQALNGRQIISIEPNFHFRL